MPNKDEVRKAKETYLPGMRVHLMKMDDAQAPAVETENGSGEKINGNALSESITKS